MSKSLLDEPDPIPDGPDYADQALASLAGLELIAEDGEPMESGWHRKCMNLLIEQIEVHLRDRDDYYVGGNMFIYFSVEQAKNRDFRGPDFFFVWDTNRQPVREHWTVWEEGGRTPNVVIELTSPSTRDEDHDEKFRVYRDRLRVTEYFIYDPSTRTLEGWRLDGRRYRPLSPDAAGRIRSEELELSLGTWDGEFQRDPQTWLRFYDPSGLLLPTEGEEGRARAEAEKARAEAEKARAEAEKARADAAEAETARLRELLARLEQPSTRPEKSS